MMFVSLYSNTMGAISGAGMAYPSRAALVFFEVRVPQSVFCVAFCTSSFFLAIIFSVLLRFTASGYPFCYLHFSEMRDFTLFENL